MSVVVTERISLNSIILSHKCCYSIEFCVHEADWTQTPFDRTEMTERERGNGDDLQKMAVPGRPDVKHQSNTILKSITKKMKP